MAAGMAAGEWKYRGRVVTAQDLEFIREFIAQHPGLSRRRLSARLCQAWEWKQANGALCDMVCRGLLLLHRGGEICCRRSARYRPTLLSGARGPRRCRSTRRR